MTSLTHKHTFWFVKSTVSSYKAAWRLSNTRLQLPHMTVLLCIHILWLVVSLCDALLMDTVDPHTNNFSCMHSDRPFWYEWCNLSSYSRTHNGFVASHDNPSRFRSQQDIKSGDHNQNTPCTPCIWGLLSGRIWGLLSGRAVCWQEWGLEWNTCVQSTSNPKLQQLRFWIGNA